MEATVLSVGKSVLNGALRYAKSALAEEVALQLGVRRDQLFITNELEMMQAFLMSAHDEGEDNRVVKVWVKQVRDMAYDVEDTLQEFAVRLEKQSWWRIRRTLLERSRVAKQMKELRANVEDVSQRNKRYNLIKGSVSNAAMAAEQSHVTSAALFGIDEARRAAKQDKSKVDLAQLINEKESDLRVIAVWGTSADLGQTSIVRAVYENPDIKSKFPCRAWVRLMHPFDPQHFIQSLVEQFHTGVGAKVLLATQEAAQDLAEKFDLYVNEKRYLIVLNDLSTIEEWDRVKKCFPNNQKGSRIIVLTSQVEVASLCAGQEIAVSELKQLSADQNIYAFHEKGPQDGTYFMKSGSSLNRVCTDTGNSTKHTGEISEDQPKGVDGEKLVGKSPTHTRRTADSLGESHVVGRANEKNYIIKLISNQDIPQLQVISVWGMGGLGKTSLVKDIYQSEELSGTFEKRACVTLTCPFNLEEFLRSLVMQLDTKSFEKKDMLNILGNIETLMPITKLKVELARLLEGKSYLIVLDDVSSTEEWNTIMPIFHDMNNRSRIVVTTREENVAKHCSKNSENIYKLKGLEDDAACELFTKKVFKQTIDLGEQYPELVEQAQLILRKCGRLPLAIVTIGGFLANQPKTTLEWRKLNDHISAELEMNQELGSIRTVLMRSYDGLPYHLKSCFLYLSIFPEDHKVGRRRLVLRWTAEGYSSEVRGKFAEEISDSYFMELVSRSMILASQLSMHSIKGIDACQVHDLMREISISKSMEENLVFRLEEGCNLDSQATVRHLAIGNNWKGDQSEFESTVDMSRLRSITVFGEWKPFYISDKMRLLRVVDLEDTTGLFDHHLEHIGKLIHLRYLSLRGCREIYHLPDSFGNLRQLQTIDVRGTRIVRLPKIIIKLRKLRYLHAGMKSVGEAVSYGEFADVVPPVMKNMLCLLSLCSALSCLFWCVPQLLPGDGMNRRDVCTAVCCYAFPAVVMQLDMYGVLVPRGMKKLKALRTLGVVNITRGKFILQDIKGLTQLRKLAVTGINKGNGQALCSATAALSRLESLSMRSEGEPGLFGCLDGMSSPPENLQSLKLYGNLVKLPEWVEKLKNLVKLKLRSTSICDPDGAMLVLGKLPNLASLHLLAESFKQSKEFQFNFYPETFTSLVVLELDRLGNLASVKFDEAAVPKLEILKFYLKKLESESLSGLSSLPSLKQVLLEGSYTLSELKYLRAELVKNLNEPILKRVYAPDRMDLSIQASNVLS